LFLAQPTAGTLGNRGLRSHTELDGHGAYIAQAVDLQNVNMGGDVAGTLDTTRPSRGGGQAVAIGTDCYNGAITGDVAATMGTPGSSVNASGPTVMQAVAFKTGNSAKARSNAESSEVTPTLGSDAGGNTIPAVAFHPLQDPISSTDGSTHCMGTGGSQGHASIAVATAMTVRRLSARECERLQGFPDDWTLIPWRGKPAEQCPDGPRYKALGNSMACNVMAWIGEKIAKWEADHA
jgi:DNA (cytosine-5)-methyltransferase 1